ncbi:MAG: hypothetical protein ACI37T_00600 [Candidatus Gastranaerophilaceae bacterium]
MDNNNFDNKCSDFIIFTEDFCINIAQCSQKGNACKSCGGFNDFFKWLFDKNPNKKSFFEI